MCFTELLVWTEVYHRRCVPRGSDRANNLVASGKRGAYFDPDFNVQEPISGVAVDRHVSPGVLHLCSLNGFPNQTTRFRHDPGQLAQSGPTADDGDGPAHDALDPNGIAH